MDMRTYQQEALKTDQVPGQTGVAGDASLVVPLLGLAGEAGELLTEYKKRLRDGEAHKLFKDRVAEELGDLLWYIANVASKFGLDLSDIADGNLTKIRNRWDPQRLATVHSFDADYPEPERLPRRMDVEVTEIVVNGRSKMRLVVNGKVMGDDLTDNAYDDDGYRFHDVFHFAYVAILGWSPVVRKLLGCKRRSKPMVDEVEDGARAAVIEEGLSAMLFQYARNHNLLDGIAALDYSVLRTVRSVTSDLEVSSRTVGEWEQAILQGYAVWRDVARNRGGRILVDLEGRRISYLGPAGVPRPAS